MGQVVKLFENSADPDAAGRLKVGSADLAANQVRRSGDAFAGVDENEAVAEAAMQENGKSIPADAAIARHEVGTGIEFADLVFVVAGHAPVAFARGGATEHGQVDSIGLNGAVD